MKDTAPRAAVAGIGCATPEQVLTRSEWLSLAHSLAPAEVDRSLLERIAEGSQIDSRGLATMNPAVRHALHDPLADPKGPATGTRIAEWAAAARPLARQAAEMALKDSGISPDRVTHVVTASCTGFQAPGVDQWLIWDLGLPVTCRRTHLGFMGCHASINSLAVADSFARSQPGAVVLMTAVEICTVHLHYGSRIDRLIANSLFADGAAAAVVTCDAPDSAPRIAQAGSTLMNNTADEMAWVVGNNGFEMTLAPSVPKHLRREVGPWVRKWLAQAGLTPEQVGGWAIHPGGPKIVEAIAETLDLSQAACEHSCGVLREHGNMSAATVMFVVRRMREAGVPKPWAAMSFGPGLAGEALLFVDRHHPNGTIELLRAFSSGAMRACLLLTWVAVIVSMAIFPSRSLAAAQVAPDFPESRRAPEKAEPPADAKLRDELRAAQGRFTGPMTLTYAGTYEIEGHLSRPHQTLKVACRLVISMRDEVMAWDSYMGPEGATGSALSNRERGILTSWGAYTLIRGKWEPSVPHDAIAIMHTIGAITPATIMANAIDPVAVPGRPELVNMKTMTGQPLKLRIDPATKLVLGAEWPRGHRRLGDIVDTISFTGFELRAGVQVPKLVEALAYEDTSSYRIQMTLQPEQPAIDEEALQAGLTLLPPTHVEPTVASELIAPGLWSFMHNESDARSLVMETDSGLLIFEAPLSSAVGEQMIDAIRARLPNKTFRAVAISHYHPHYSGGIRAFVAAGCDIYTTAGVAPFLQELLDRPFTLLPDRQATARRVPKILLVNGRQEINDSSSAVTLLDLGKDSLHTDEYLVFYFPKAKILFEADLGYIQPSGTLRIMGRCKGLLQAVKTEGWDVTTLVQSWPGHDTPPLPWTTFLEAIDKIEQAAKSPAPPPAAPK